MEIDNDYLLTLGNKAIGMATQDAIAFLQSKGFPVRISREDGKGFVLILNYCAGRFNLIVESGLVKEFTLG